jgi:hypothetical protein
MVLLPMHSSMEDVVPKAMQILMAGLHANRKRWDALADCGDPHAVIGKVSGSHKLHVRGGQAIDSMFDECASHHLVPSDVMLL